MQFTLGLTAIGFKPLSLTCDNPGLKVVCFQFQLVALQCGGEFSVALAASGAVYTWGEGSDGQLGHSSGEGGDEDGGDATLPGGGGGGGGRGGSGDDEEEDEEEEDEEEDASIVLAPRRIRPVGCHFSPR
jgi:alpha-tubulin suppressor-like RCC1 family protein